MPHARDAHKLSFFLSQGVLRELNERIKEIMIR